jgi:protein-tyrosine phosphatase
MLIDLHCHVLAGIDDGPKDLSTSIDMCRIAVQDGIEGIIATPHYIYGAINNNREIIQQKVAELNDCLEEQTIDIDIYVGSEAFICPELPRLVREGQACTINDTKYILIELPMTSIPCYTADVIYQLKLDGYTPIIAHPERNAVIAKDPNLLIDLIRRGALFQINATSIRGLFGKDIMETSMTLLKHKMVHFIASDAHTAGRRSPKLSSAMSIIEDNAGYEYLQNMIKNNQAALKGERIEFEEPVMVKAANRANYFGDFMKRVSGIL